MTAPPAITLQVQLDETDPVSGTVRLPEGPPRPFSGWLGMCAAIEALAHPAPVDP